MPQSTRKAANSGMIARRLTAKTDLRARLARLGDDVADHPLDRLVLLVELRCEFRRVAVDAQGELRQVVRANGESIEELGEFPGEDHVGRDLAHDEDLKAVVAPLQAVLGHHIKHLARLQKGAAERDHHDDIGEAHLRTEPPDGAALEREALAVLWRIVARCAAKPDHRILLAGLELGATDQSCILIGLEIAHADDCRLRIERRRNP